MTLLRLERPNFTKKCVFQFPAWVFQMQEISSHRAAIGPFSSWPFCYWDALTNSGAYVIQISVVTSQRFFRVLVSASADLSGVYNWNRTPDISLNRMYSAQSVWLLVTAQSSRPICWIRGSKHIRLYSRVIAGYFSITLAYNLKVGLKALYVQTSNIDTSIN